MMRIISVASFAFILLNSSAMTATLADDVTLDQIVSVWNDTQNKVKSGVFEFTTSIWSLKGSQSPPNIDYPIPERDMTLEFKWFFVFRDGQVRFERNGPFWNGRKKEYTHQAQVYTWDSKTATFFNGDADDTYAYVYGLNNELSQSGLRPIQLAFRMNHPEWYVFQRKDYKLSSETSRYGGLTCRNVEMTRETMDRNRIPIQAIYSVCPQRGFSVVHYEAVNIETGKKTVEFDIEHVHSREHSVWVPHKWTISMISVMGAPFNIETSEVTSWKLNVPVPDSQFTANLPANTIVYDNRAKGKPEQDYLVRKDGEKRVITREESLRDTTREEIAATPVGMAGLRNEESGGWSLVSYIWIFGVVALLAAVVLVFRSKNR